MKEIPSYVLGVAWNSRSFSPLSVTIAQWIEETGWGASDLAKNARNLFGIKYASMVKNRTFQTGGIYTGHDGRGYASYHTYDDCGRDRYRILLAMGARIPPCSVDEFLESFTHQWCPDSGDDSKAGYANRLRKLIQDNDLARFDLASYHPDSPAPLAKVGETSKPKPQPSGEKSPVNSLIAIRDTLVKAQGNPVVIALEKRAMEGIQQTEGVKDLEKKGVEKFKAVVEYVLSHPENVPVLKSMPSFLQTMAVSYIHHYIQDIVDAINHTIE